VSAQSSDSVSERERVFHNETLKKLVGVCSVCCIGSHYAPQSAIDYDKTVIFQFILWGQPPIDKTRFFMVHNRPLSRMGDRV
jgi:hypothetical protein